MNRDEQDGMLPVVRFAALSRSPDVRASLVRGLTSAGLADDGASSDPFSSLWGECGVEVAAADWERDDFDLLALDDEVWRTFGRHGRCELRVFGGDDARPERLAETALQIAIRFQRFDASPNPSSSTPFFSQVLAAHERLFDRSRPLVAADHEHALDTWRWLLRLDESVGVSVQLAALFHDIERLATEADARVEHRAGDYEAFKREHARAGSEAAAGVLVGLGTPPELVERTRALIAAHEGARPCESWQLDDALATLANADALSFFSLNAPGFARYFGPAHTARKVAFSAARLDATGRAWLARVKVPAGVAV